jgi:predicted nucleic acid-binding protein
MLLVDTNVLVDVLQNDPQWADWSIAQLRAQAKLHALVINPVIYAEMSLSFSTLEALDDVVSTMELELHEIPRPALFLAAKAYAQYRRRGGSKGQVLPDFFIGAHAAVEGWPLLTRDANRFKTYFPTPPMATSNSPTCGHPKFPQARRLDYEVSGLMAMRVAASLRR